MTDFREEAQAWLRRRAEQDQKSYEPSWEVSRGGRVFPLVQRMEIRSEHAVLSLRCGLGREGVGREFCYYDLCPHLDGAALDGYFALLEQLAEQDTDSRDPHHDFTFSSLVLLTDRLPDREARRALRRYRFQRQFSPENREYGWNAARVCVVELGTGEILCSALGDALKTRLEDGCREEQSLRDRLRSHLEAR